MQDSYEILPRKDGIKNLPSLDVPNPNIGDALPEFDDESSNEDAPEVPIPPPQLKAKPSYQNLEDIEDQYLEENAKLEEGVKSAKERIEEKKKRQVFVNVKDYGKMVVTMNESKTNFKVFSEKFANIDNLNIAKDEELIKCGKALDVMQRKLIGIDNRLFEKMEDE